MSRSAVSEICGFIRLAHKALFNETLIIRHEHISLFQATRDRVELPLGWNDVIKGLPKDLLQKKDPSGKQYDKIIYISRGLVPLTQALARYHRQAKTELQLIDLMLKEPNFFSNIKKKWLQMEKPVHDKRFLKISVEDWNWFTFQTYNDILDFLDYPSEGRPLIAPIDLTFKRNFEGYSCSHLDKDYKVCSNVEAIRAGN